MVSDIEIDHIPLGNLFKNKHWVGQNGAFKERKDEQ